MINNQFNDLKNHLGANKLQAPFDIIETTCPLCEAYGYRIGVVNDVLTAQCPVNGCENSDVFKILFEDRSYEGDLNGFRFDETILNNPPAENDPRLYKYLWRKTLPLEGSPCARVLEQRWGLDPLSFSNMRYFRAFCNFPEVDDILSYGLLAPVYKVGTPHLCGLWNWHLSQMENSFYGCSFFSSETGGAVWLDNPGPNLLITDWIEEAFIAKKFLGTPTWMFTDQVEGLRNLILPPLPLGGFILLVLSEDLYQEDILPDIREIIEKWRGQGRRVELLSANERLEYGSLSKAYFDHKKQFVKKRDISF